MSNTGSLSLQLDDAEFQSDLPEVDEPPTLESILNEVRYLMVNNRIVTSIEM